MKVLVVLAHPNPQSFNQAIAQRAVQTLEMNGHEVIFHDLYREKYDPILEYAEIPKDAPLDPAIQKHCEELANADGVIIVHPDWWGQPPAILKGWLDRTIRAGYAYRFDEVGKGMGKSVGLLKAKAGLVFNTSNTPREVEISVYGDPLEGLWKACVFGMCGVQTFYRKMYGPIVISTLEQRRLWLDEIQESVSKYFPR